MEKKTIIIIVVSVIVALLVIVAIPLLIIFGGIGILGTGLAVYNNSREVVINKELDSMTVQTYNDPFIDYEGSNVYGSKVRALCEAIKTHNQNTPDRLIELQEDESSVTSSTAINIIRKNIRASSTYKVEMEYDDAGYINRIKISSNQQTQNKVENSNTNSTTNNTTATNNSTNTTNNTNVTNTSTNSL